MNNTEPARHTITSVEDISNLINEDNFANFMIDFTDLMIKIVKVKKKTKELNGSYPMGLMKEFTWIDDKKNGVKEMHFNGEVLKFDTFEKDKL